MASSNPVIAMIPARYAATRFPGKPLANETGKPLIRHVIEQVRQSRRVQRIIVATDDPRIAQAGRDGGAETVMTRSDHPNGASRLAEAAQQLQLSQQTLIINVQGDEPEIEPMLIDQLIQGLLDDPEAPMATLASPFAADENPADPNIVKLVCARVNDRLRAMYFSRALIPHVREMSSDAGDAAPRPKDVTPYLKHPGLYAYRLPFLLEYATLSPTQLEQAEQLEQLRALEHGRPIAVVLTSTPHHGIDTPAQYAAFVLRHHARSS